MTVAFSGQVDFLADENGNNFQEVDFKVEAIQPEAVWDGVLQKDSMWAYADQGSYKMALRKTYKSYEKAKEKAQLAKQHIETNFNDEKLYEGFVKAVYGEQIDVDEWLKELEEDFIEQD